jgi:hypothetical protein
VLPVAGRRVGEAVKCRRDWWWPQVKRYRSWLAGAVRILAAGMVAVIRVLSARVRADKTWAAAEPATSGLGHVLRTCRAGWMTVSLRGVAVAALTARTRSLACRSAGLAGFRMV